MKKKLFFIVLGLVLFNIYFVGFYLNESRELYTYNLESEYVAVGVNLEGHKIHLLDIEDLYSLWVSRTHRGQPERRVHYLNVHLFNHDNLDPVTYLKTCKVVASPGGISFVQPSGHTLFIPESAYR
ncbi:hypothetical protein [Undibacterium sp. TS12]|uniref:hypothetical protein n=1 Tax=Undibacterium sp. TS12 TaxID=2908202 RepID=UPI001F4C8FA7|nr:hypothetical protein [Undibacterium sp. TS12]MCH8622834.1 hypothetical protein [Undibacterium sp. TS12]